MPLGIAEMLDLPCLTVAQKVDVADGTVSVQQVVPDGYRELEAGLPAPGNRDQRARRAAIRDPKRNHGRQDARPPRSGMPTILGIDPSELWPQRSSITDLYVPETDRSVEIIEGEDDADAGRKLALKLREDKLI